jgi:PKD repeat protein
MPGGSSATLDADGSVGMYTSAACDGAGGTWISYYDATNGDLKCGRYDGAVFRPGTVDAAGTVGLLTSLALDPAGAPGIAYCDSTNGALKYARYDAGTWTVSTIGPAGLLVAWSSLALDGAGDPAISYRARAGGLAYARGREVVAVPPSTQRPTDTDGDGVYDDVNGNGRRDFADVVLYFDRMAWIAANEPITAFDCNGNGRIDFADAVRLFSRL